LDGLGRDKIAKGFTGLKSTLNFAPRASCPRPKSAPAQGGDKGKAAAGRAAGRPGAGAGAGKRPSSTGFSMPSTFGDSPFAFNPGKQKPPAPTRMGQQPRAAAQKKPAPAAAAAAARAAPPPPPPPAAAPAKAAPPVYVSRREKEPEGLSQQEKEVFRRQQDALEEKRRKEAEEEALREQKGDVRTKISGLVLSWSQKHTKTIIEQPPQVAPAQASGKKRSSAWDSMGTSAGAKKEKPKPKPKVTYIPDVIKMLCYLHHVFPNEKDPGGGPFAFSKTLTGVPEGSITKVMVKKAYFKVRA